MANFIIGLDFGTSQTKVCLFNTDDEVREFLKFDNGLYFLPSLVVKKPDGTFGYGSEEIEGSKYRYFKMAVAEDDELIHITNEDFDGNLQGENISDYEKYKVDYGVKPDILVILYITYIYLYIKDEKKIKTDKKIGGLLGQLTNRRTTINHTFSVNLGIPTEWNNYKHIKRKIKFQSLLITAIKLAKNFNNIESYLLKQESALLAQITEINKIHLLNLKNKSDLERAEIIDNLLKEYKLSVYPESAAGINYLLKTERLTDGSYASLDIGAGTSDIAFFEVTDNKLSKYFCSESIEIASNDFYREYAKLSNSYKDISFDDIKNIENFIKDNNDIDEEIYIQAVRNVNGKLNKNIGITFAIRKIFFRKYYHLLYQRNQILASNAKAQLTNRPIIVFGGGANIEGFASGDYCFYLGSNPFGNNDCCLNAKPITEFVRQVDITNDDVMEHINLLVLAMGLTYVKQNHNGIPFIIPENELEMSVEDNQNTYFYYDLQDAVYQ